VQVNITHISGMKQGERETLSSFPFIIGRAPGSKPRLAANDTRASARHAEVNLEGDHLILHDLGSTNGTYLNGQRVDRIKLISGDIVEFGIDGPKLRFDFARDDRAVPEPSPQPLSPAPVQPASGPPPLAVKSSSPGANSPQFNIANQGRGLELAVAPPTPAPMLVVPMAIEEHEFPYKNRFKFVLLGAGVLLFVAAILLFLQQVLIWTVPVGLIGLFLCLMGWSCWRINITANNQGIYYQGILRSKMIRWDDVVELRAFRSRTRLLTHLVYIVRGRNGEIVFAPEDYENGFDLAALIARRVRLSW
jgi:hypothetical protein